jgi:SAM-dependent methyltransferase
MHVVAARGFAGAGDVYEQGRPDYPAEAVAHLARVLAIIPGSRVLDLGAGTGKLTRRFTPTGAWLLALEPVEGLRRTFARQGAAVPVVGGTAEAIPLGDGTIDAVVAGTAFHWFDGQVALQEIHRVLRPQGRLGLVWNARDETVDWVAQLVRIADAYKRGSPPRYTDGAWRQAFASTTRFTPLEARQFPFTQHGDRRTVLARAASTSFIGALPPVERQRALRSVAELLDTHPATRDRADIGLPYRADVYWCARR